MCSRCASRRTSTTPGQPRTSSRGKALSQTVSDGASRWRASHRRCPMRSRGSSRAPLLDPRAPALPPQSALSANHGAAARQQLAYGGPHGRARARPGQRWARRGTTAPGWPHTASANCTCRFCPPESFRHTSAWSSESLVANNIVLRSIAICPFWSAVSICCARPSRRPSTPTPSSTSSKALALDEGEL